jgi:hypothetical protein
MSPLVACTYSAHSEIVVHWEESGKLGLSKDILELQQELTQRSDSCFSKYRAVQEIKENENMSQIKYRVLNTNVELDIQIYRKTAQVMVSFDEWMESSFSYKGKQCYQQVLNVLKRRYGEDNLNIIESCKARDCFQVKGR